MNVDNNLQQILKSIAETASIAKRKKEDVLLVAVSKGRTVSEILEAYHLGLRDFGENRVDEALDKMGQLPKDIRWHFIGKIQKNKVNKIIGRFDLIHSVDTVELAEKISNASRLRHLKTPILLEVNTAGEATKSGLSPEQWEKEYLKVLSFEGIEIEGLMTMAPLTKNEKVIHHCFAELHFLLQRLQHIGGRLSTLSMGMTHDYPIAIQEGATIVRIGTALFTS